MACRHDAWSWSPWRTASAVGLPIRDQVVIATKFDFAFDDGRQRTCVTRLMVW
jgi:hypothetical protein